MENKGNRKDWVKNVAIIFLSILLVLTFFSNTIMNYSLPEVATTMIEPGSITAKIRGTGTLSSDDPYKITIEETRVVSSVAVKAGDTVEKDQILFYLEDKESDELKQAEEALLTEEKALDSLLLSYSTKILEGSITNEAFQKIQSGAVSSNAEYQARIEAAKQKVKNAEDTVASLDRQVSIAGTASSDSIDKEARLSRAKQELDNARTELSELETELAAAKAQAGADAVKLMEEKHLAEMIYQSYIKDDDLWDTSGTAGSTGSGSEGDGSTGTEDSGKDQGSTPLTSETNVKTYKKAKEDLEAAMREITVVPGLAEEPKIKEFVDVKNINSELKDLDQLYTDAKKKNSPDENSNNILGLNTVIQKAETAIHEYERSYNATLAAKTNYDNAAKAADQAVNASKKVSSLESAVNQAKNTVDERQTKVTSIQNEISNNQASSDKQKSDLSISKVQAEAALKEAQNELSQLLTDVSNELNLDYQNDLIVDQRKKVEEKRSELEKIREKSIGTTIKAPVAGVVTSISITAGEKADPTRELAMMQPEGKGFSMSFSVTAEQAKKVKVGDKAEIQNSWFYNDIEATLTGIRPDPEDAGQKKLLVFDVKGDVQAGQSISLSIGQKSAEYDLLVPNSAVREDNQGKFILIVESKNSPLGNRYIAKRVDVEVLGADDLKTAISAALYGYEYVITTATQPVEAGKQIRLADSD